MSTSSAHNAWPRQWTMLLVYHIYRLINIAVLFGLLWFDAYHRVNKTLYGTALLIYLLFGILFLYIWFVRALKFKQQVLCAGILDTIVMVLFIHAIGYMQSGLGILLSAPIAMLSILVPGRLAIFFAAIASCMLLLISVFQYEYGTQQSVYSFFIAGMYGAVFFATALTAWYLARWVRLSENLAQRRGRDLVSMQRLNKYIIGRLQYGVIYVDAETIIKVINTAAQQFFGGHSQIMGALLQGFSAPLYALYQQFLTHKNKTGEMSMHAVLDAPYLQLTFFATSSLEQPAVLIILDDMALIAQQAQQLKLASLGRFSASIAHELRNPLGVISHAAQLMMDGEILSEENQRLTELILNHCNRMNAVIQNVLQVSRRHQAKPISLKLSDFLSGFQHEFCLINACKMTIDIDKNQPDMILFDQGHLEQIMVILCDNAMQHGRNSHGDVSMRFSLGSEGERLMLLIQDTGPGIPPGLQQQVFEPFFSTAIMGNGMGLFIAKELCEINQAHLDVYEVSEGCCFGILFHAQPGVTV